MRRKPQTWRDPDWLNGLSKCIWPIVFLIVGLYGDLPAGLVRVVKAALKDIP